jgi:uncharacterized protein (TIGR00251 family)
MSEQKFHLHDGKAGAALAIRITPRARRNEIVEVMRDGTIRIRLTASSTENESNTALVNYLSKILGVHSERIEIVAGETGRDKLVSIIDMDAEKVHEIIIQHL